MLLEVKKLNKKFGSVIAADNINFSMDGSEVIGIIGSNGAGKTTFCNIITGYIKKDEGVDSPWKINLDALKTIKFSG